MPRTRYTWRRHKKAQGQAEDQAAADCTPISWDNGEFYPLSSGQLPDKSNFNQCIPFIGKMDVVQIQAMVKLACIVPVQAAKTAAEAAGEESLSMQAMIEAYQIKERVVERALLAIFGYESIKPIQLRVIVRQLPSAIPRDTLLVAKTGFGKSMTFQAFAPLTGMITIQVIPLSKLGEEQAEQMSRLPGAKPVVITAETKLANPHLYREICEGKYNHILIGPEQLLTPEFRNVLKSIHNRVGLLAIDEVHLIEMWGQDFRQLFTSICETRRLLPKTVNWYGCTATLNEMQQRTVQMYGGFRDDVLIIRTSIDRPELGIIIRPILKGDARTYSPLFFLLHGAVSTPGQEEDPVNFGHVVPGITAPGKMDIECFRAECLQPILEGRLVLSPQRIPKTIVYVDGTKLVCTVADRLRTWLLDLGYKIRETVDIVSSFSSYTSSFDKRRILTMFAKESSIRILIATNAVGMGMDICDVDIVVQWGFPLGYQVADLWQRWGRAARGPKRFGTVVLFCPYWALDSHGYDPEVSEKVSSAKSEGRTKGPLASRSSGARSKRVRFILPPNDIDTGSDNNLLSESERDHKDSILESSEGEQDNGDSTVESSKSDSNNHIDSQGRRPWNAEERRRRAKLEKPWLQLVNAPCIRKGPRSIFDELGEGLAEKEGVVTSSSVAATIGDLSSSNQDQAFLRTLDGMITTAASQEKCSSQNSIERLVCCSGSACSPQLAKEPWDTCPNVPKQLRKPQKASLAGRLLEDINAWVQSTIEEKYGDVIGIQGDIIMDLQMRIAIANGLGGAKDARKRRSEILASEEAFYREAALSTWEKQLEHPAAEWEQDERLLLKQSLYDAACSWESWDAKAYVDEAEQQSSEEESLYLQTFRRNATKVANQCRDRIRNLTEMAPNLAKGSTYTLIQEELTLARREFDVAMSAETELERVDQIEKSVTTSGNVSILLQSNSMHVYANLL
jgi:superfamily II DNA helicase RecQ